MKIISVFNNKTGVGKTILTYHLAHTLADMGKKVLILDLDSQCNLSLYGMTEQALEKVWHDENILIDNSINIAKQKMDDNDFDDLFKRTRTIHFMLKPVEDSISDFDKLPPPFEISPNLHLIPGRSTLFAYEREIAQRWTGMYLGSPASIRTVLSIRKLAEVYSKKNGYDFVMIDTAPNLGALNKIIISMADGFFIPCLPDMFSLYALKNMGAALAEWEGNFYACYQIISKEKRKKFPEQSGIFLGYTIYNAKKNCDGSNPWHLAQAHYKYAQQIPKTIAEHFPEETRDCLSIEMAKTPIGNDAVMHTHNTLTKMAKKYKKPIWLLPSFNNLDPNDKDTIKANRSLYEETKGKYIKFATDFLERVKILDE